MTQGLHHDPDLDPVPAAKAALEEQARRVNPLYVATVSKDGSVSGIQEVRRTRPVVTPAKPEDWSKVVMLQHPLLVDDVLVDRLVLKRITARDVAELVMDGLEGTSLNAAARALVAGVHPDVLENLAAIDAEAVLGAIGPFLPPAVLALAEAMEAGMEAGLDEM